MDTAETIDLKLLEFNYVDWNYYKTNYSPQIMSDQYDLVSLPPGAEVHIEPLSVSDQRAYSHFFSIGHKRQNILRFRNPLWYKHVFGIDVFSVAWDDYSARYGVKGKDFELLQHYFYNRFNPVYYLKFKVQGLLYYNQSVPSPKVEIEVHVTPVLAALSQLGLVSNMSNLDKLIHLSKDEHDIEAILNLL